MMVTMKMKRTIIPIAVLLVTCSVTAIATRIIQRHEPPQNVPVKTPSEPIAKKINTVNYKGVSFTFDSSLASEVKSETLPQATDGKPCDIVPEHPAFTLVGAPRPLSMSDQDPHIRVFSLTKFREAVRIASDENRKSVVYPKNPPNWTTYFDEEVRVLRALLEKKPKPEELGSFLAKVSSPEARQFNDFPQMPFLPMWEAAQAFFARPQYLRFKNGHGIFFLTQWNVGDTSQVTNSGLECAFQGLTDDGEFLVYAEFSVAVPFLPSDDNPEVVAWNEKNYLLPQNSKTYQAYLRPIVEKLQMMPSDQFRPNLKMLEQLITSMEVKPETNG